MLCTSADAFEPTDATRAVACVRIPQGCPACDTPAARPPLLGNSQATLGPANTYAGAYRNLRRAESINHVGAMSIAPPQPDFGPSAGHLTSVVPEPGGGPSYYPLFFHRVRPNRRRKPGGRYRFGAVAVPSPFAAGSR